MAILHLLRRSASSPMELAGVLGRARMGDGVLLLGDAAYAGLADACAAAAVADAGARGIALYCLAPDLEARGIVPQRLRSDIQVIEYSDFVDLSIQYQRNCSW
ncbi:sulfurtransferase complex subunit TusB [Methyloterricola oryzae]|uniref:sulfurtransferase complex subunit TusB n=1 Tax=Methyloterricola oryzae TaxID=1495050 RepID=UPI0005EB1785|nr:sulfurtransferase complex subunit TusB [Methyloterricola oryzae]